jgi:predicted Zn-dependent peptidase
MPALFHQATLPNGLRILAEVDPSAHTAAMGYFVKTGARDERGQVMGVSHFLEHMMFKGTAARSAEDVDREFSELGAEHNAFTTSELTAFWVRTLPERLVPAEEILSDILRPALRPGDFDAEKKVILEEIAMYQDQPFWVLYEQAMDVFYGGAGLGHRVLGTEETITRLTREQMVEYFAHRYSADNTVVALAGRLDFDDLVQRLARHCGGWARTGARRAPQPPGGAPKEFTLRSPKAHQHYFLTVCPGPAVTDDLQYAASALMDVLGDSEGSRLYWALVETGLADEAQAQYSGRDGLGELLCYAVCAPENGPQVELVLEREVAGLLERLEVDELERVKSKLATNLTLQGELPGGRMRRLGQVWTYLGRYRSLEEDLARVNALTLDDLRAVGTRFPMTTMLRSRMVPA